MPAPQTKFGRISHVFAQLEEWTIAVLLAAMTLITFVQVVLRYVFNSGFIWALELTSFLFVWLVLFGMAYVVKVGGHIAVDVITRLFPEPIRKAVALAVCLVAGTYAVLIAYGGWELMGVYDTLQIDAEDLPVPMSLVLSVLPIGASLLLYRLIEAALQIVRGERLGMSLPVEEEAGTFEAHHEADEGNGS